jgi:hypothetical protein
MSVMFADISLLAGHEEIVVATMATALISAV